MIARIALLCVVVGSYALALTPMERAAELRRQIEVSPSFFSLAAGFESADETVNVPLTSVFAQGSTPLCWAFAALNTARGYYLNAQDSEEVSRWREFLKKYDTSSKYRNYIATKSEIEGGWPNEALLFYDTDIDASDEWVAYVPSSTQVGWGAHPGPDLHEYTPDGYFMPLSEITVKIRENLKAGIPSAYCTAAHCVSITGATFKNGEAATYQIADSASGSYYTASASHVHSRIADITTLSR